MTLKSTSLERTSRIAHREERIQGVRSLSLKEGANYQLQLLGSFVPVVLFTFNPTFLCGRGVSANLEPALHRDGKKRQDESSFSVFGKTVLPGV